ncbi:penicillin acylase family protein [Methylothermus subterraneus]
MRAPVLISAILGMACVAGLAWLVGSSLPQYRGEIRLPALEAPVTVAFDRLALPTIDAQNRQDALRALGFLHAQERLLQMELTRRKMAGTLAEVFGEAAFASDLSQRTLGFSRLAQDIAARLPEAQRSACEAYAQGVNAYLDFNLPLFARLLGMNFEPWRCRDTMLVVLSMFQELDEAGDRERMLTVMAQALPEEVVAFLTPDQDPLDLPLLGQKCSRRPIRPVPVAAIAELLSRSSAAAAVEVTPAWGSNQWAIASPQGALVANDMHLALTVPNLWYRARLRYPGVTLDGITLPGVPGIVAGSNGHIAWGFTNAMADVRDFVVLETDPADPKRYRTPEGWENLTLRIETVAVKGQGARQISVSLSRWGPVVAYDEQRRPLALHWSALDPSAVDLALLELDRARTVQEALAIFNRAGMPVQNALVGDAQGHIGWTLSGRLPRRDGLDGTLSLSWADGKGWRGYYTPYELPRRIDPPTGVLATANHRTLGCDRIPIGHHFALSFRIHRIDQQLAANPNPDPYASLALQLDTDARFYRFYQKLAARVLQNETSPLAGRIRAALTAWNGRADPQSQGIALLDRWRLELAQKVFGPLLAKCLELDPNFRYLWLKSEVPLRQLLRLRHPATLPDRRFPDWQSFLRASLLETAKALEETYRKPIDRLTWGEVNRAQIRHPLAHGRAWLGRWLNLPEDPLAGCAECVRVARPSHGASMRLTAVAGRPGAGLLQMPGGQSGHPLSPHYADQHAFWLTGKPLPLAPGRALSTLRLRPGRS